MKKEDFRYSFDMIKPDESARKRMLDSIMQYADKNAGKSDEIRTVKYRRVRFRIAIPVFVLTLLVAAGIVMYSIKWQNNESQLTSVPDIASDMAREDAPALFLSQFQIGDRHYIPLTDDLRNGFGLPATINEGDIGEKIADITASKDENLKGKEVYRYVPAGSEAVVAVKGDDGYQLYRFFVFESINNNQDEDAAEYLKLYGVNSAEDIAIVIFIGHSEQSKLQGVTDIIGEITDRKGIARFYDYYSVLKDSSDKYYDKLFNYSGTHSGSSGIEIDMATPPDRPEPDAVGPDKAVPADIVGPDVPVQGSAGYGETGFGSDMPMEIAPVAPAAPDYAEDLPLASDDTATAYPVPGDTPVTLRTRKAPVMTDPASGIMMDTGDGLPGTVQGSTGSAGNALDDSVTIRIYNRSGIYFDSVYYRNIGFINRYEVSEEFAAFLSARFQ